MFRVLASLAVATTIVALSAPSALARGGQAAATPRKEAKPAVAADTPRATALVNLNTAPTSELEKLPGIGAKVAARIVDYRQKKGPFKKVEELMNVEGIGEKSFLKLRSQLTVGAAPDAAPARQ